MRTDQPNPGQQSRWGRLNAALRNGLFLALSIASAFHLGQARAAYVVDTGVPDGTTSWTLISWQYFAGKFTIGSTQNINSIESYFSNQFGQSGNVTFEILADAGLDPSAVLFSQQAQVTAGEAMDWHGAFGLSFLLQPGTYWVAAVPDSAILGQMQGVVPNPMLTYDQNDGSAGLQGQYPTLNYQSTPIGFRISASSAPVPEPSSLALLGFGLASLAASRRHKQ